MRTRAVVGSVVAAVAALLALEATAQEPPRPSPKHIEVPDPGAENAPPPPAPAPEGTATPEEAPPAVASASGRAPRRGQREMQGAPPQALSGRYEVVQVTELGETEDFRLKMERAGRALNQDCITVALIFDFGEPGGGLPNRVRILERQECYKGGLGRYANELALELPVAWSKGEGAAVMTVPEIRATANLVRIRTPEGSTRVPQWLGPETKVDRARTEYKVVVEAPKRAKAADAPDAVHLLANQVILHLEPKQPGGPFAEK